MLTPPASPPFDLSLSKMLSPISPPPPLPGPGGADAHQHHFGDDIRRPLSNHEVAEYLSSRKGERDAYYLYQGRVPQALWAFFLHRHPLLSSRVQVRGDDINFIHTPNRDILSAKEFAAARSHYAAGDLVLEFHKRRYLANDRLAYLITGEQAYLLIVASCIEGFGWADELSRDVQGEMEEEELETMLENTLYSEGELRVQQFGFADAVAAILRGASGGQAMPSSRGSRRTVYLDAGETITLKERCKSHGVDLPHVLVAACAVAYAKRARDRREPILIHLISNHTNTRQISTISLSCLYEPSESLLWRRAKQAAKWRRYNPLSEARRARYVAEAADVAAMNNPGLGLGIVMPRREAPRPPDSERPPAPPSEKVLMRVSVDVGSGPALVYGTRSGPALNVAVRETTSLVFTDLPEIFVDDVLAILQGR